jgi:hypothetical protein
MTRANRVAVAGTRVSKAAGTVGQAGRRTTVRGGSSASASSGSVRGQRVFITLLPV